MATGFYLSIFNGPELYGDRWEFNTFKQVSVSKIKLPLHLISGLEQSQTFLQRQTD